MHQSNLRKLATLMYTVKHRLSPEPILQLFTEHHNHELRKKKRQWEIPNINTVTYGMESLRYQGPQTWELLPEEVKQSRTLSEFKNKIKT